MTSLSRIPDPPKTSQTSYWASHRIPAALVTISCLLIAVYASNEGQGPRTAGSVPIELIKVLTIGDANDDNGVFFGRISGLVAVDGKGRIFVGEGQDPQIYAFTAQGKLLASIGAKGNGPGEFARVTSVHTGPGDTLYVFDSGPKRISAFDPATFDLAYDVSVAADSPDRRVTDLIGVLETGFVVTYEDPAGPGTDFASERYMYTKITGRKGRVVFNPMVRAPALAWMVIEDEDYRTFVSRPFGRGPVIRLGPDEHIYSGSTESIDIAITAADGTPRKPVRHPLEAIPVTKSELDERLENHSVNTSRRLRALDLPKTKPAYSTLVVGDSGRIWVRLTKSDPNAPTAEWLVLNTESQVVGELDLPSSVYLQVVAAGRAYAVDYADGVVLTVYEIVE